MSLIMDVLHKSDKAVPPARTPHAKTDDILGRAAAILEAPEEKLVNVVPPRPVSRSLERPQAEAQAVVTPRTMKARLGFHLGVLPRLAIVGLSVGIIALLAYTWLVNGRADLASVKPREVVITPAAPIVPHLEGVILGGAEPLCVLNGQTLAVGGEVQGYTVRSIRAGGVRVSDRNGKTIFLRSTN